MAPAVLGALFSVGVAFADSDELIRRAKDDWVEQQQNLAALSKKPLLDLEFE
ncbi:BnaA09g20580D [Brassica napus]|uniref:BnaA09g20580D protein n=1 Tax=Brassica napus TaxID=3708 RepID=A0A078FQD7_BRANA|nr:BnaA09g20580D [Brassica napus]